MPERSMSSRDNVPADVDNALRSPGRPLDPSTRRFYEARFGAATETDTAVKTDDSSVKRVGAPSDWDETAADRLADQAMRTAAPPRAAIDFSGVRLHFDDRATESARSMGASAYTVGQHVVIRADRFSSTGATTSALVAHELAHTVLASRTSEPGVLRRRIDPEDVASEMVGSRMTVTASFAGAPFPVSAGSVVLVVTWVNTSSTARVQLPTPYLNASTPFDIPKRLLEPDHVPVAGVAPYSTGVAAQARTVERGEAAIATERTRRGGPRPRELARLTQLQETRERLLNRRLIQARMFNRFDAAISRWTAFYNTQPSTRTADPLDPNLVKAMLFEESQLGTSGQHLEDPPSHPVKTRFNLGQAIDSSGLILLTMMDEINPALLTTFHLQNLRNDLISAQRELATLRGTRNATPAQQARLTQLTALSAQSWEVFIWSYRAAGQSQGFAEAVTDLFAAPAAGGTPLNLDYDFWIRTAIRWLFEKRRSVSSWAEAIRAYNGSGARARHYRDAVVNRAGAASQAQRRGDEFIPGGI
ncbi:MAG: DUF4157 domain-containing protein [Pseudonocardiaceae bacterium]